MEKRWTDIDHVLRRLRSIHLILYICQAIYFSISSCCSVFGHTRCSILDYSLTSISFFESFLGDCYFWKNKKYVGSCSIRKSLLYYWRHLGVNIPWFVQGDGWSISIFSPSHGSTSGSKDNKLAYHWQPMKYSRFAKLRIFWFLQSNNVYGTICKWFPINTSYLKKISRIPDVAVYSKRKYALNVLSPLYKTSFLISL